MSTPHTLLYAHVITRLHHTIIISVSVIYYTEDLLAFKHARDSLRSFTRQLKSDFEKNLAGNIKTM